MKYKKAITLSRAHLFRAGAVLVITTLLLVAAAATAQTYTVLYNFGTNIGDPLNPQLSDVIAQGRDGSLYSTTFSGGAHGLGTVFDITPGATLTVLYDFDGTLGELPNSGLTLATDGKFYGTTAAGGPSNAGTIFNTTPSGKVTVLYNFTGGSNGSFPSAPPIQGADGSFYGTTPYGGHKTCNGGAGCGTVYKLTRSGQFTTLHQFQSKEGAVPPGPVVEGTDGNLYGTTVGGGTYNAGVVFKLTTAGKYTVLHNFDPYSDGKDPVGPLVQGSDGNFYGTTVAGRDGQIRGVVFKITPTGSLTVLHRLNGTTDGDNPYSGLVQATDGNFYGTASAGGTFGSGTIFRLSPKRTFTVLHNFDNYDRCVPSDHTHATHQRPSLRRNRAWRHRYALRFHTLRRVLQLERRPGAIRHSAALLRKGRKHHRVSGPRIDRRNCCFLQRDRRTVQSCVGYASHGDGSRRSHHRFRYRDHAGRHVYEQQEVPGQTVVHENLKTLASG